MAKQKEIKLKSIMPFATEDIGISPELTEVQALMPIDLSDRANLKRDIEESGEIRDPIKVYADKKGNYLILCGYNRWQIAQELGWPTVPIEIINMSQSEREELVWKDNLNRRHLTTRQKQNLIDHFLKLDPELSNRAIAKRTTTDDKTVGQRRKQLESGAEIPHLKTVKGMDGKEYSKKESHPVKPVKEEPKTDKKSESSWWTPEMEAEKKKNDKLKLLINKKFQYQIDLLEDYIKQCRKSKKEKEQNEARIMAYQISITSLKELLKEILKEI